MVKTSYSDIPAYVTKDGSEIRELMHPDHHGNRRQSLAEATVQSGRETVLHKHLRTEELYHITAGRGLMTLDDEQFAVTPGDTVRIPPGTPHCIRNIGADSLRILCCCSPPYSDEDTVLLTGNDGSVIA
jgi:mannose-6-phosphate isomerase-like protein (cupin superfamily)